MGRLSKSEMGCGGSNDGEEEVAVTNDVPCDLRPTWGQYIVQNVFKHVLRRGYTQYEYQEHYSRIDNGELSAVGFFKEILECEEFQNLEIEVDNVNFVRLLCRIFLARAADDGPCEEPDTQCHGGRLDGEEISRYMLAQEFAGCEEAHNKYRERRYSGEAGSFMNFEGNVNAYFLQNLFHGVLARGPREGEFNEHLGRLDNGDISKGGLLYEFFTCPEVTEVGLGNGEEVPSRWIIRGIFIASLGHQPDENWDQHTAECDERGVEAKCNEFCECEEFNNVMAGVNWGAYTGGYGCGEDGDNDGWSVKIDYS